MYNFLIFVVITVAALLARSHVAGSQVPRIRGIPVSKSSLYSPDRDFECLDGSLLIPFVRVNDDYCDCGDGSDEPGTPACTNGSFYCQNAGHQSGYIPSTWVNDGVCDCCDASDEYASGVSCVNNCHELGREARIEAERAAELAREGNKIRLEMVAHGKQIKKEQQAHLAKLRTDYEEALLIKREKEILNNAAEERKKAALEKYKPVEQEQPVSDTEEEEIRESEAEDYFKMLDSDSNGIVTVDEIQTRATFDKNRDGAVSEDEALFFLNNNKEITLPEFVKNAWATIKPFLMLEQGIFKPAGDHTDAKESSDLAKEEHDTEGEDHDHDEVEDQDHGEEEDHDHGEEHEEEIEEPDIQYDEETQSLIDEANQVQDHFRQAEKAVQDLQKEISIIEEKVEREHGPDEVFASLDGECFEYTDLEYVYSLCLFGKATQKSKSGGSEIGLGYWHEWVGPEENKYSVMKYDRGLTCWNGPARSTIVTLTCGRENQLLSVSEPSRCEYAMEFATPALCDPSTATTDSHDEL